MKDTIDSMVDEINKLSELLSKSEGQYQWLEQNSILKVDLKEWIKNTKVNELTSPMDETYYLRVDNLVEHFKL